MRLRGCTRDPSRAFRMTIHQLFFANQFCLTIRMKKDLPGPAIEYRSGQIVFDFLQTDSCILCSPSQNRTVSVPKTYGFGSENVRFWDGNHKREIAANRLLIIRKGKRSQSEADYTVCGMYLGNQTQRRKANRCHSLALFALSKNKNLCVFASLCL